MNQGHGNISILCGLREHLYISCSLFVVCCDPLLNFKRVHFLFSYSLVIFQQELVNVFAPFANFSVQRKSTKISIVFSGITNHAAFMFLRLLTQTICKKHTVIPPSYELC